MISAFSGMFHNSHVEHGTEQDNREEMSQAAAGLGLGVRMKEETGEIGHWL